MAVTGTRGKSTVVRLITAALAQGGISALAKTTGSLPVLIYPGGEEKEIPRRGVANVLEGIKLLETGAALGVQVLVAEMMSVRPESIRVESRRILEPHVLVVTNVRIDHVAEMGGSRQSAARCLANAIDKNMTVLVPEEECTDVFEETALRLGSKLVRVPPSSARLSVFEHEENIRLALAVTENLGVDAPTALRGMERARRDLGALKIWSADIGSPPHRWRLVSLFAANDPESCRKTLSRLQGMGELPKDDLIGLLCLRHDRGDRSFQWLRALRDDTFPELARLFLVGGHARLVGCRLRNTTTRPTHVLRQRAPETIMEAISRESREGTVLVGMGNMGGFGKELVAYWNRTGKPHDL